MSELELVTHLMNLFEDTGSDYLTDHQEEVFDKMGITRLYIYHGQAVYRVWGEKGDLSSLDQEFYETYQNWVNQDGCLFYPWNAPARPPVFPKQMKNSYWYPVNVNDQVIGFICADLRQITEGFEKFVCQKMFTYLKAIASAFVSRVAWEEMDKDADRLQEILNCVNTYLYTIGQHNYEISYVSQKTKEAFPHVEIGNKCYQAFFGENQNKPCAFCPIRQLKNAGDYQTAEIYMEQKDKWYNLAATSVDWMDGSKRYMLTLNDVSKIKENELAMQKIAYHDQELGLLNHAAFIEKINTLAERKAVDVFNLIVDINDFKTFNSIFGHSIGDKLLKEIAKVFVDLGLENMAYRFSGGQFCILVDESGLLYAVSLLRNIRSRLATNIRLDGKIVDVGFNVAIISSGNQPIEVDHFIAKIQYALEEVKQTNNNFLVMGKTIEDKLTRKNLIKTIVKKAIKEKQLTVVYQPIYAIQEQKFVMAEALVRLSDHTYGPISPGEFIPIAEEIGCVHEIDMIVLEQVCQHMDLLHQAGIASVHVNMSPAQFIEKNFVQTVLKMIDRHRVNHQNIILEVTETVLMNSLEKGKGVLSDFMKYHIRTSLDDFGSGYSSLNYVVNLPFDSLKIDRSLTQNIEQSERTQKLIKAIIQMSHDLQMETIAEGVENFAQYDMLRKLGCDYIQGFYFARPTDLSQLQKAFPPLPPEI